MHQAAVARVMPNALSFGGRNFDIVTGVTALLLAPLVAAGRAPRALVIAWNVMGLGFLAVIIVRSRWRRCRAIRSPATLPNTWVCYVPFVWLPTVLVPAAIAGHVLVFRRLAAATTWRRAAGAA